MGDDWQLPSINPQSAADHKRAAAAAQSWSGHDEPTALDVEDQQDRGQDHVRDLHPQGCGRHQPACRAGALRQPPQAPNPACFAQRVQVFANGQRCDDINYYGRTVAVHDLLKGREYNRNKAMEGFDESPVRCTRAATRTCCCAPPWWASCAAGRCCRRS